MNKFELKSVDVYIELSGGQQVVNAHPQEAFHLLTMPSMAGLITKLVPHYELSEMPQE